MSTVALGRLRAPSAGLCRLCNAHRQLGADMEPYRQSVAAFAVPHKKSKSLPYVVGLTGGIGMGKTVVGQLFESVGVPVQEADGVVHALYSSGGGAVPAIAALFPDAIVEGAVDRSKLASFVLGDSNRDNMQKLEAAVHPLVQDARTHFLQDCAARGARLAVLDIPLLFEKGLEREVDAVVVVSAPATVQQRRVLERPGMTLQKFRDILARQVSDEEKRMRADYVIDTSKDLELTKDEVLQLVGKIKAAM